MPKSVVEELECWKQGFGNHHAADVCSSCLIVLCVPFRGRWIFVLLMGLRVFLWMRRSSGCKGKSLRESQKALWSQSHIENVESLERRSRKQKTHMNT